MEYFIGSITTLILISILAFLIKKIPKEPVATIRYSQSHLFSLTWPIFELVAQEVKTPTQATKHFESTYIKIFVSNDKAYWIKDNKVFVADIVDDEVASSEGREVDMMGMNNVQLKEMLFIIDKLKEDSYNDNWNAG